MPDRGRRDGSSAAVAPAQGASDAFARGSARRQSSLSGEVCRRPDVLEEGVKSFDNSRWLERWFLCSRGQLKIYFQLAFPRGLPLKASPLTLRHRMRQGYPLNLSISLSGGEETNQDAPSNGE